jgi:hypothetical protein
MPNFIKHAAAVDCRNYNLFMARVLRVIGFSLLAVVVWAVLFEFKTCACGDKLSLADRAVNFLLGR